MVNDFIEKISNSQRFSPETAEALRVMFREITEKKLTGEERERNLELLTTSMERDQYFRLFTTSPNLMCIFDPVTKRFTKINPAGNEMLGYSDQELTHRSYLEFIHPDDRQKTIDEVANQLQHGYTLDFENRYLRKDGTICWLSWRANFDRDEGCIYGVAQDITGRKEYDRNLEEAHEATEGALALMTKSEARFHTIFEDAPLGIALVDSLTGQIREVNSRFAQIAGRSREEMVSTDWMSRARPDDLPADLHNMFPLQPGEISGFQMDKCYTKPDGSLLWVSMTIAPVTVTCDDYPLHLCMIMDISDRKQFEVELNLARLAAEAANHAKSEFLSNMSHEIRTPMNGILGMTQLLEHTALDSEQMEYLQTMRTSSEILLSLINDVLDLSKIDSGTIELENVTFSLRSSIADVIKSQIPLIHGKKLSMDTDIPSLIPDNLTGDKLRLKQILLNFLSNAIKFTDNGGIIVTVGVSERRDDVALLKIGVTDSGVGISPDSMAKIFEPFAQENSSTTRKFGGTGLGLSISTKLAEMMGGRIWVESSVGIGSTFYLEIPFVVNKVGVIRSDRRSTETLPRLWNGPILRALLVDDQKNNLFVTRTLLQKAGHSVSEAYDGREALEKWENERFDVILMDIHMPVMSGIEATQAIRSREKWLGSHQPIIAVTALALSEEREAILGYGFDGYLAKPIMVKSLFDELSRCVPERYSRTGPDETLTPGAGGAGAANYDPRMLIAPQVAESLGEDSDDVRMYLVILLEDLGVALDAMEAACRAKDAVAIAKTAHTVRGLARGLRDTGPEKMVENIEADARNGAFEHIREKLFRLRSVYATILHTFSESSAIPVNGTNQ